MDQAHAATPSGAARARALGVPFDGVPGPCNAITDVADVELGYATIIRGEGKLVVGEGPVRTGVTAILPRGRAGLGRPVFAGAFSLNGNGELTGTLWIEEAGQLDLPITITNTHACGLARDATLRWMVERHPDRMPIWGLPVAGDLGPVHHPALAVVVVQGVVLGGAIVPHGEPDLWYEPAGECRPARAINHPPIYRIKPSASSFSRMRWAASSGAIVRVSISSSGFSGAS